MIERRLVIDTNVIISAALWSLGIPSKVLKIALRDHTVLVSDATFAELERKLFDTRFDRYATLDAWWQFVDAIATETVNVTVSTIITACRDPKDNQFLALAVDLTFRSFFISTLEFFRC
jgi:putative PIN family toxin of toxin-antitoxin system